MSCNMNVNLYQGRLPNSFANRLLWFLLDQENLPEILSSLECFFVACVLGVWKFLTSADAIIESCQVWRLNLNQSCRWIMGCESPITTTRKFLIDAGGLYLDPFYRKPTKGRRSNKLHQPMLQVAQGPHAPWDSNAAETKSIFRWWCGTDSVSQGVSSVQDFYCPSTFIKLSTHLHPPGCRHHQFGASSRDP